MNESVIIDEVRQKCNKIRSDLRAARNHSTFCKYVFNFFHACTFAHFCLFPIFGKILYFGLDSAWSIESIDKPSFVDKQSDFQIFSSQTQKSLSLPWTQQRDNLLKAFLDNGDVLGVELLGVSLVDQAHQQQGLSVILRCVGDDRWWSFIWIFWDQPFHLSAPDYHRWFPPLDGAPPSLEKQNKTRQQFNKQKTFEILLSNQENFMLKFVKIWKGVN